MEINSSNFPSLHKALENVSHDTGWSAGWKTYILPASLAGKASSVDAALDKALKAEAALAKLSPDNFEELCCGDAELADEILLTDPALNDAVDILDVLYERRAARDYTTSTVVFMET